jgi:hypothetical protein
LAHIGSCGERHESSPPWAPCPNARETRADRWVAFVGWPVRTTAFEP